MREGLSLRPQRRQQHDKMNTSSTLKLPLVTVPGHPTIVKDSLVHDHAYFKHEDWHQAHTKRKQHTAQSMMLKTMWPTTAHHKQLEQQSQ